MLRKFTRPRDPSTPATATPHPASHSSGPPLPAPTTPLTSEARRSFQEGFQKFERTVKSISEDDHRDFSSTTLEDVRTAARQVEKQLAARQCLRNLHRIQPLLNGLEHYSKVVEVLCNGTPYLPWIWAPIKLFVQLSMDFQVAFDKLIDAYVQIAENLPRFDRLSLAYRNSPDFQRVLSVVYRDILEFHRRAYKFFRCSGWKCFFKSSWGGFEARFKCILESLSRHSDLVDREANALLIEQTIQWREQSFQDMKRRNQERATSQVTAVQNWLGIGDTRTQDTQEDHLDRIASKAYPGTADWIIQHKKIKPWLRKDTRSFTLWLKGKPGSGKTTLCAQVVRFLSQDKSATILFCFYSYLSPGKHPSIQIFATLISQILRQYPHLSAYVYADYLTKGAPPTLQNLKTILSNLLSQVKAPRILVDGIDECIDHGNPRNPQHHNLVREVLRDLLPFGSQNHESNHSRLFVVSRDIPQVAAILNKKPTLSLDDESAAVNGAIRSYTLQRLQEMQDTFDNIGADDSLVKQLENSIVQKSQGMFLWVQLVLADLEDDVYSLQDLKTAIARIPTGLNDFYYRIISRLKSLSVQSQARALHILEWMMCARRPLRASELQDGLTFCEDNTTLNDENKLPEMVLYVCKPLIQFERGSHDRSAGTVKFIHFTVQEYLRSALSGPFVDMLKAEYSVTSACLGYLNFSKVLINARMPEDERTVNVGKGFHSLHLYVHVYWLDHLLSYVSMNEGLDLEKTPGLRKHLIGFLKFISLYQAQLWLGDPRWNDTVVPFTDSPSIDPRLQFLKQYPQLFMTMGAVLHYREHERQMFTEGDDQIQRQDPTPLSKLMESYNRRVQILLTSESFPGLSTQLAAFKSIYGPFAFVCRFPGCAKSSEGFATDQLRVRHERSHAPSLVCTHSGCSYRLAFTSVKNLNRHVRENHETVSVVPKCIRSSRAIASKRQKDSPRDRNSHHSSSTGSRAPSDELRPAYLDSIWRPNRRHDVEELAKEVTYAEQLGGIREHGNITLQPLQGQNQPQASHSAQASGLPNPVLNNPLSRIPNHQISEDDLGPHEQLDARMVHDQNRQYAPFCVTCNPRVKCTSLEQYADHLITTHPWAPIHCEYCSQIVLFQGNAKFINLFTFLDHIESSHKNHLRGSILVSELEVALKKEILEGVYQSPSEKDATCNLLLGRLRRQHQKLCNESEAATRAALSHPDQVQVQLLGHRAQFLHSHALMKEKEIGDLVKHRDYIMQLALLEEQNKKRAKLAMKEQTDTQINPNGQRRLENSRVTDAKGVIPEQQNEEISSDLQMQGFSLESQATEPRPPRSEQPIESRQTPEQLRESDSVNPRLREMHPLQVYQQQLMLLEQQKRKRLLESSKETESKPPDNVATTPHFSSGGAQPLNGISMLRVNSNSTPKAKFALPQKDHTKTSSSHNASLQDDLMQLMLLEPEGKKKKILGSLQSENLPTTQGGLPQMSSQPNPFRSEYSNTDNSRASTNGQMPLNIQEYQRQLVVREQMRKKRLLMAREEQDGRFDASRPLSKAPEREILRDKTRSEVKELSLQDYQIDLMMVEQQNKRRLLMARKEQDGLMDSDERPDLPSQPFSEAQESQNDPDKSRSVLEELADYQRELSLREEQNKNRLSMARNSPADTAPSKNGAEQTWAPKMGSMMSQFPTADKTAVSYLDANGTPRQHLPSNSESPYHPYLALDASMTTTKPQELDFDFETTIGDNQSHASVPKKSQGDDDYLSLEEQNKMFLPANHYSSDIAAVARAAELHSPPLPLAAPIHPGSAMNATETTARAQGFDSIDWAEWDSYIERKASPSMIDLSSPLPQSRLGRNDVPLTETHATSILPYNPQQNAGQPGMAPQITEPPTAHTNQRPGPSSYWSVIEQNDFKKNVAHFGTNWAAIARHMGTKTQTMVKNYYLRLLESGRAQELAQMAQEADAKRQRGEDLGPPPIPDNSDRSRISLNRLIGTARLNWSTPRSNDYHNYGQEVLNESPQPQLQQHRDIGYRNVEADAYMTGTPPNKEPQLMTISPRDALLDYNSEADDRSPEAEAKGKHHEVQKNMLNNVSVDDIGPEYWRREISLCYLELDGLAKMKEQMESELHSSDTNPDRYQKCISDLQSLAHRMKVAEEKLKQFTDRAKDMPADQKEPESTLRRMDLLEKEYDELLASEERDENEIKRSASPTGMTIHVKTSGGLTIRLNDVKPFCTILGLKHMIQENSDDYYDYKDPVNHMLLVYNESPLRDQHTLSHYNIQHDDEIHLR